MSDTTNETGENQTGTPKDKEKTQKENTSKPKGTQNRTKGFHPGLSAMGT